MNNGSVNGARAMVLSMFIPFSSNKESVLGSFGKLMVPVVTAL